MGFFFMDVLHVPPEHAAQYNMVGQLATSLAALFAQLVVVQYVRVSARVLTNWGLGTAFLSTVLFLLFGNFVVLVSAWACRVWASAWRGRDSLRALHFPSRRMNKARSPASSAAPARWASSPAR